MTEERIGGATSSMDPHWSAKMGGTASPASAEGAGPHFPRNSRTLASCAGSRFGAGSGIQMFSWKAPLLLDRTSRDQERISSGCMSRTPHEPRPPAFATAMDNEGAEAPAIGASNIGARRPKRSQNFLARLSVSLIVQPLYWSCIEGSYSPATVQFKRRFQIASIGMPDSRFGVVGSANRG
jgi:hypothetical protein